MKRTIAISIIAILLLASCATKTEDVSLGILQTIDSKTTETSVVDPAMEIDADKEEQNIVSNDGIPIDDSLEDLFSATDEDTAQTSDETEAVVQPIVRHYTYEGYDFSLSAYPGRLYLVHPEELGSYEIDMFASYLMQRYPHQLKDVTYSESNGVLTLTYPESWTVAELDYAQSVLMDELAELAKGDEEAVEPPTERTMLESERRIAEDVVGKPLDDGSAMNAIDDGTETPGSSVEDVPAILASENEWWNDPIFEGSYDPSVEEEPVQNEDGMEIQTSEGIMDLEAFDWMSNDVPQASTEINSTPDSTFEDIESNEMQREALEGDLHQKGFADKAKALLFEAKEHAMRLKDTASKKLKEASFEDRILIGLAVLFALVLIVVLATIGSKGRKKRKRRKEFIESSSGA